MSSSPDQPSGYPPSQPAYPGPEQPGYPAGGQPYPTPPPPDTGPGQPGYPPAPPPKKARNWVGIVVILVIVGIVGAFFLLRDRFSNEVTSLAPGECFDEPADTSTAVSEVQRQPCNEPHDAEVIASLTHPAPAGESYPVVSGFADYIQQNCIPIFETYTGTDWETSTDLDIGYFRPTMDGWAKGDRGFTCYVYRVDETKMTSSVRAGAPST